MNLMFPGLFKMMINVMVWSVVKALNQSVMKFLIWHAFPLYC